MCMCDTLQIKIKACNKQLLRNQDPLLLIKTKPQTNLKLLLLSDKNLLKNGSIYLSICMHMHMYISL